MVVLFLLCESAGKAFFTATELGGELVLRFSIGSSTTQLVHVQEAWAAIQAAAGGILKDAGAMSREAATARVKG